MTIWRRKSSVHKWLPRERKPSWGKPPRAMGRLAPRLALAADGLASPPDDLPVRFGDCLFTDDILALFPRGAALDDELIADTLLALRAREAHLFGFTPAAQGIVRMPADFEPVESIRLVYPGWRDHDDFYGQILAGVVGQGIVHIHLLFPGDRQNLIALLRRFEIDPGAVQIHLNLTIDSIWVRDYGPISILVDGQRVFIDGRYNVDCVHDDAMPSRLAAIDATPLVRPPLLLEGGNLLSDGRGTGFTTHHLAEVNHLREEELAWMLDRYLGFEQLIFLEPLIGDVIEHVDMFLSVADEQTLLLGQADPMLDPDNYVMLEENADRLSQLRTAAGTPYRIVRVPMPPPLPHNPANGMSNMVRSYLNLVPFNGVVLVPTFSGDLNLEALALARIADAFPRRRVIPIHADGIAPSYGTIHCVTQTTPARPLKKP
ncbi:MAG: agmatine deiminase family protein [Myxococcota bacterium]